MAAWIHDREPEMISAQLARRDAESTFDWFGISLDSRHDHLTAYVFAVSASGTLLDGTWGADGRYDPGWDPVWESATRVNDEGWTAEMRIPLSQLRFDSGVQGEWGLQIIRRIHRKAETDQFAFVPLSEAAAPFRYGHLVGLGMLEESARLELLPHIVGRQEQLKRSPGNPFRRNRKVSGSLGIDLKYGLTSSLTLDGSINPDFGQVEVDPAVVNLTAYETFYPERRPFFSEGAELFRFGPIGSDLMNPYLGQIFYSRRIGRAPQHRPGGPGVAHVDIPEATTIAGAAKLTGRAGANWSLGFIEAVTLEETGRFVDGNGERWREPVEPLTNHLVGRIRRDFRSGSTTMGGIFTAVNRDVPSSSLECLLPSHAYVAGLDFMHAWKNREWFVSGSLAGSRIGGNAEAIGRAQTSSTRYYQRPDAEHLAVDPSASSLTGHRATLFAGRQSGDHWLGWVLLSDRSPGWEVNDAGFETRSDKREFGAHLEFRETVPNRWFQSFRTDLVLRRAWNYSGDVVGSSAMLVGAFLWKNYWQQNLWVRYEPSTLDDRILRGGPLGRSPSRWTFEPAIFTDRRRPHSLGAQITLLKTEHGGWGVSPRVTASLRPSPGLALSFSPSYERVHSLAQYVATIPDASAEGMFGNRYLFSDIDRHTVSLDTRVDWTFTPKLTLQLFLRPFVSSGAYTQFKEWKEPGVWGFDVYGEDRGTVSFVQEGLIVVDPDDTGPAEPFHLPDPDFNYRSLQGNAVLRWEYRPGSTLYLVWQQGRRSISRSGVFDPFRDYDALLGVPPENIFVVKASYWLG